MDMAEDTRKGGPFQGRMCGTGCAAQGGLKFVRNSGDNRDKGMGDNRRITCHELAEYFYCPRKLYIRTLGAIPQGDDLEVGSAYHALAARAAERQASESARPWRLAKVTVCLLLVLFLALLLLS